MHIPQQRFFGLLLFALVLCLSALPAHAAQEKNEPFPNPPQTASQTSGGHESKDAAPTSMRLRHALLRSLPFADASDFENARRGFIGGPEEPTILNSGGRIVYSLAPYDFLRKEPPPPTINPSLWRQARLNLEAGLFKVTDGIYQVRGLDLANMTIIEGDSGLILIDPLQSRETAAAALTLYRRLVPAPEGKERPVRAVIYTHPHVDHFGGVKGVISEEDVQAGKVAVLAPEGFMEAAISENLLAGNAMSRRAMYMYGIRLPRGERGQVGAGLGKAASNGEQTLIAPTDSIRQSGEKRTLDGVEIEFLLAPETEAPVEMLMYFPQFKALCSAEETNHSLHNLYTLRGAQVRDAVRWWKALDEALDLYGRQTEVLFAQHYWPLWGQDAIIRYLSQQRNAYKYLHDQVLRLANLGLGSEEIGESIRLPASLEQEWHLRGYYGTVNHNAKAIYQRYFGWYSGHPADLHPLPPVEAGKRYVEFMGGAAAVIARAKTSYDQGEYRWVAEVMKHVVFADPDNEEARLLQADALEQLGYQAEAASWRNVYLTGAFELRRNAVPPAASAGIASPDVTAALTPEMVLDYMAIHLNGPKADGKSIRLNWRQEVPTKEPHEDGETYALSLEDAVLVYKKDRPFADPDATLTLPRAKLADIVSGQSSLEAELTAGRASISGNADHVRELFSLLDVFSPGFPIVTPRKLQ